MRNNKKGKSKVKDAKDPPFEYTAYIFVGLILSAIRRNGLEATLQDLQRNCRHHPKSDEATYRDFLDVLNSVSEKHEAIARKKGK